MDNGALTYAGSRDGFLEHDVSASMIKDDDEVPVASTSETTPRSPSASGSELIPDDQIESTSTSETNVTVTSQPQEIKKASKKLYEEEKRAVGRIARDIWIMYLKACGSWLYWICFTLVFLLASISPVINNGWLR